MNKPVLAGVIITCAAGLLSLKIYDALVFEQSLLLNCYAWITGLLLGFRLFFAGIYREPDDTGYEPHISIIIAAKDEEKGIGATVCHCMASDYPNQLMDVIVIDDGSRDGTWDVLVALKREIPRLRLCRFTENRGKRAAMAWGIQRAEGDILVFLDSDTMVSSDAIRRLVHPFADCQVGAVSGHIRAEVASGEIIPRMEAVRYFVSHRLFKASESFFSCVTCCPGAFSAYRKSEVLKVLNPWLDRSYLGTKATFGDDRSLTNLILRNKKVLFHNGATAFTEIPASWMKFFRQQIRWKKSWFIESPRAISVLSRKNIVAFLLYTAGVLVTLATPVVVFADIFQYLHADSIYALRNILGLTAMSLFFSLLFFASTRSRYWYYGLVFTMVYFTVLSWLTYYAIATVRRTQWGTR